MKNFYEILEVKKNASYEQIRDSFIRLMAKYHPDIYSGDKEFAERYCASISEAYATLSDFEKRKEYDVEMNINPKYTILDKNLSSEFTKKTIDGKNYEQQISKKYFRNTKKKRGFFKRLFTSKLFYSLLFVFTIEMFIILYFIYFK